MVGYALIKRDGSYVRGELPEHVEKEKFCIMCAAAFVAGTTAHKEYGDKVKEVIIRGEESDVIIAPFENNLLAVIGRKEDFEEIAEKLRV